MKYRLQTTIFPDTYTLEIINPITGEYVIADEVRNISREPFLAIYQTKDRTLTSHAGETLEQFAQAVARWHSMRLFPPTSRRMPATINQITMNIF